MKTRIRQWIFMALLALSASAEAVAETGINTDSLRLTFDSAGNLQSALACFPACTGENARVQQFADASAIRMESAGKGRWTQSENSTQTHYELTFRQDSGASLTWRIPFHGYSVDLEHSGIESMTIQSGESFRPREAAGFGNWLEQSRYVILDSGDAQQVGLDESDTTELEANQWLGYRNRYWTLMAAPSSSVPVRLETTEGNIDAKLSVDMAEGAWTFYLGPIEPRILSDAGHELSNLLYAGLWFWLRWICFALFHLLAWIHMAIPSWGLSVMALSLTVNVLMTPLSRIAERFQDQVNDTEARLAPELQRIKKNYKGEVQAAKILALYKTERVHPLYSLKSLMGVAVVIPVFIGAFDMLAENIHLLHTGFLWISDLSRPDDLFNLPFTLPFFGNELNALPFLMTGLSVVASSLHNPPALNAELRKKQVRNMLLLAVAFFVLFYTFPAGMVLYWTTNNLISVIKSLWARR
ncbi:membrane protein insertase YidC [Pseudomonadota bacterium]